MPESKRTICTGEKIILREIRDEDILPMWQLKTRQSNHEFFYEFPMITLDQHVSWVKKVCSSNTDVLFTVADKQDNFVGFCSLYHIDYRNRKCEYGRLLLDPSCKGRGYGRDIEETILDYAFNYLGMHKVYCEVLASNENVIEMHKKTGFKIAGTYKEHIFKDGKFVDVVYMEIFR